MIVNRINNITVHSSSFHVPGGISTIARESSTVQNTGYIRQNGTVLQMNYLLKLCDMYRVTHKG